MSETMCIKLIYLNSLKRRSAGKTSVQQGGIWNAYDS